MDCVKTADAVHSIPMLLVRGSLVDKASDCDTFWASAWELIPIVSLYFSTMPHYPHPPHPLFIVPVLPAQLCHHATSCIDPLSELGEAGVVAPLACNMFTAVAPRGMVFLPLWERIHAVSM